jgi:uncharacterized protein (TIGR03086 family)
MHVKDLFKETTAAASGVIVRIQPAQLHNPTPCTKWDLRSLLGHMTYEMSWVPDLLAGKTIKAVGDKYEGDLLGDDPLEAWGRALAAAVAAVEKAHLTKTVHLSYGDFSAEHYIWESASDMLIHGWDVSKSIGHPLTFDTKVAAAVYEHMLPRAAEFQGSGLFGEVVPTKEDDAIQTKLLAFYGRRESWRSA